jgi:hypothetical protein
LTGALTLAPQLESSSMATLLADPPTATDARQPASSGAPVAAPEPGAPVPASERSCANCGAPMAGGQEWCLQCGAGAPGSLGAAAPSWRSAATLLLATAVLVLGAAAAGYAALDKGGPAAHVRTVTQASVPPATGSSTTPAPTPTQPKSLAAPTPVAPTLPKGAIKAPKIPLTAATPRSSGSAGAPSVPGGGRTSAPTTGTRSSGEAAKPTPGESQPSGPQPNAILLDTNAASTYNPSGYPASEFGDPSLAIDGDISTAWTAQVEPASAPNMAAGLMVDLKSPRRLAALQLLTTTPGMTVQVYGAVGAAPPATIADPAWVKLSSKIAEAKRHQRIKLTASKQAVRFVTLWISKAPAASVGTPQAPGHVSIHEVELIAAG